MKLWCRAVMATLLFSLSIYGYASKEWKKDDIASKLKSANKVLVYLCYYNNPPIVCTYRIEPLFNELLLELCNGLSQKMNSVENGGYIKEFNYYHDIRRHRSRYSDYDLVIAFKADRASFYDVPKCGLISFQFNIDIYDVNTSSYYHDYLSIPGRDSTLIKKEYKPGIIAESTYYSHINETEEAYISRVAKYVLAHTPFQELAPKK